MRVCGVDIKSNEARLAIVGDDGETPMLVGCDTRKITLGDDKDAATLKSFLHSINAFAHENAIDAFSIKARAHKGKMAGGAVSFKIETLIQLVDGRPAVLVNPVALSNFAKKNVAGIPGGLFAYQEDAFRCAAYYLHKEGLI